MPGYYEQLEFDLPKALIASIVELFDSMQDGPLTAESVASVGNEQGVYQILLDGQIVYVGKTDSDAGLQARLKRHSQKILWRKNLDPARVTFKAVRVYVFSAMDLEQLLIKRYQLTSKNSWNHSGFGSNDPGVERDTTKLKGHHFDKKFPIDLDIEVDLNAEGVLHPVDQVLKKLRDSCPYLLRFETDAPKSRVPHPDLVTTYMNLPPGPETVRTILRRIKSALGPEWQITSLPGYVIGYKDKSDYPDAEILLPI